MVNWTQRFITGIIVGPLVLYAIRSQLTTVFIANRILYNNLSIPISTT